MTKSKKTEVATRVASANADTLCIGLSEALKHYLAEVGQVGASGIQNIDDAVRVFQQHQQAEAASRVMQGWVLASVAAMGQESLRQLATRVAISKDSLRQLVSYFQLFQSVPDLDSVRRCAHLDFTIAREVARWPAEQQVGFLSGERMRGVTYDETLAMTSREFLAIAKPDDSEEAARLKAKVVTLETKLESAEAERDRARNHLQHKLNVLEMPEFCAVAREEAAALTEQMDIALNGLEALLTDNLLASHSGVPEAGSPRFQCNK